MESIDADQVCCCSHLNVYLLGMVWIVFYILAVKIILRIGRGLCWPDLFLFETDISRDSL